MRPPVLPPKKEIEGTVLFLTGRTRSSERCPSRDFVYPMDSPPSSGGELLSVLSTLFRSGWTPILLPDLVGVLVTWLKETEKTRSSLVVSVVGTSLRYSSRPCPEVSSI